MDTNEQCDPPDGETCNRFCMSLICGDGVVVDGEECDPPDGVNCDDNCNFRCGNGIIDPGEECDPAGGEICDNLIDDDGDGQIDCRDPECAAIPRVTASNRPTPFRPVTILPPSRAGSVTSTYLFFSASASMMPREVGLPISSSGM